ncbi:MAG: hypothetical protein IPL27_29050 [Lewinellaceae bacterium]|nr:hypothetical protein [Lewinellaceae bacterium]
MFRRRAQRIIRRMERREDIPPALQQANQMMENGEYKNAAEAFHTLAKGAEERFPHRAPFLYIEAGRAAILGGETKLAWQTCAKKDPFCQLIARLAAQP